MKILITTRGNNIAPRFDLTSEERCAVTYGDVRFIESRIGGKLGKKIMDEVMIPLLSRESW